MVDEWRIDGFVEVRELGRGAQGRVALARHTGSGTPVAIKYLSRNADVERLRQEAVLLGRVSDPHVARLYRLVESDHGAALVMEAVNGVSLKRVMAEHRVLAPEAALTVLKGSLLGLAAAHAAGVVHRDYKPANVVVQADGLSKLIDFGIAALSGDGDRSGTPAYMPPEQWRGEPATPAADVYAATCVFYECITGRRPYEADNPVAMQALHQHAPIPVESAPEPLRNLLTRGMAKDPSHRPWGAASFVDELEEAAVAAYGPTWETNGLRTLAGTAVALAALFPLVAAGLTPAASVTAGTAAASGAAGAGASAGASGASGAAGAAGASGAAGTSAGGSGLLAGAGTKVAVAVAGTAVAASAGGVAVYAGMDDEPAPRPAAIRPVSATTAVHNQTFTGFPLVVRNAQYMQISGHTDPAVQRRINQELRAPLDKLTAWVRNNTTDSGCGSRKTILTTTAQPGLRGPALVSVVYTTDIEFCSLATGEIPGWAVTVDLKTGRVLTARDIFRPEALTASGLRTLWTRLTTKYPFMWGPRSCTHKISAEPGDLFPAKDKAAEWGGEAPPDVTAFPTPDHFEVNYSTFGSQCPRDRLTAPYAKVRDLLKPEFLALVEGQSPTPQKT